jgi:serine/threonine protein kinase
VKNKDGSSEMLILNELCEGGTLIDLVEQHNQVLSEQQILSILKQVIQGLKHMHSLGIAHRDIKIENILLHDHKFKLADFGSASIEVLDYSNTSKT